MRLGEVFVERFAQAMDADPRPLCKIALTAGYSEDYVSAMKNGRKHNPTLAFVETMALTLGCDPLWLLGKDL